MTRRAAEKVGVAVVNVAPDNFFSPAAIARDRFHRKAPFAQITLVSIAPLARSHTSSRGGRRIEKCVLQVERLHDSIKRQLIEPASHQAFEQKAEHDETEIAVNDFFTGPSAERFIGNRRERAFLLDRQQIQRSPRRQT